MQRAAVKKPERINGPHRRSGIATVWIIASVPAIITMLILLADVGTLWLARYELETATEAAALAAVKEWKATNDTNLARTAAQQFALTNTVLVHKKVVLTSNGGGGGVNDNSQCNGDILLGQITSAGVFQASTAPSSTNNYGALVRHKIQVRSLSQTFGGINFGPYYVHAESVASLQFDVGGTPKLMRPVSFECP